MIVLLSDSDGKTEVIALLGMVGGSSEEGRGVGGTYPSPAARTCSCRRCLPAPTPQGRTGLETPGTRFHEPCQHPPPKNLKPLGFRSMFKYFLRGRSSPKMEKNKAKKGSCFQELTVDRVRASTHSP